MQNDKVNKTVLVTGADGFLGANLCLALRELAGVVVLKFGRNDSEAKLLEMVAQADSVVHLAGSNRPKHEADYRLVNFELTSSLCTIINDEYNNTGRHVPLVFASSSQAESENPYGRSKLAAEQAIVALAKSSGNPCTIFRLPGVFGKWSKPNYNSVVATYCHNIARDIAIQINDPVKLLRLVYIDDVITAFLDAIRNPGLALTNNKVAPEYTISLQELAEQIQSFKDGRTSMLVDAVGEGFLRALYSTYVSFLPSDQFSYGLTRHGDTRGLFVEMLKTKNSGQLSYFTAHPGITRGGHYHHTKTEKFLVVKGEALFRFRHLVTDEVVEVRTSADSPEVVDTIPGWAHDITNVGQDEMVVMLWANENFDKENPDTVASEV